MTELHTYIKCSKCNSICTLWGNDFYVCDACGLTVSIDNKKMRDMYRND